MMFPVFLLAAPAFASQRHAALDRYADVLADPAKEPRPGSSILDWLREGKIGQLGFPNSVDAMIETPLSLRNVDDFARVPDVDMLFVGPNDLALSLRSSDFSNGTAGHFEFPEVGASGHCARLTPQPCCFS